MDYYIVTTLRGNKYLVTGMSFMGEINIMDVCICGMKSERFESNLRKEGYDICPQCGTPLKTYKDIVRVEPKDVPALKKKARGRQQMLMMAKRGTQEEVDKANSEIPESVKIQLEAILNGR
jgi:hypothetical protein